MGKRIALFTKDDVIRAVSGVLAVGLEVGEVRVLPDGSIVLNVGPSQPLASEHDDIDAKIEAFARR